MTGLMEFGGHVRLPARGWKWERVKESACLTLGRITELKKVGVNSVSL